MKVDKIVKEFNGSKFVSSIDRSRLFKKLRTKDSIKIVKNNNLIAFGCLTSINQDWCEIGPVFVIKREQGKGYGSKILDTLLKRSLLKHNRVLTITRNPILKKLLVKMRFKTAKEIRVPFLVMIYLFTKRNIWNYYSMFKKGILFSDWERYIYIKD